MRRARTTLGPGIGLVAALVLVLVSNATAKVELSTLHDVSAYFSYTQGDGPEPSYTGLSLAIVRAGKLAFNGPGATTDCEEPLCYPRTDHSVRVVELTGDSEPEVVLDLFSGGAHCCSITRFFQWNGSSYSTFDHNFSHAGYRRRNLDGIGPVELLSGDARFAYAFESFAGSLFPVQIWRVGSGGLIDVTGKFPHRVATDARSAWKLYRKYHSRGAIAAWAADRYRLGARRGTLRRLRRLADAHKLPARGFPPKSQHKFVTQLDAFLLSLGYG